MSYCRTIDSDVYAYAADDHIVCCGCWLTAPKFRIAEEGGGSDAWALLRKWRRPFRSPRGGRSLVRRVKKVGVLDPRATAYRSRREFIEHLRLHQRKGDKVPCDAFEMLREEIEREGDRVMPLSKFSIPFHKTCRRQPRFLWRVHLLAREARLKQDREDGRPPEYLVASRNRGTRNDKRSSPSGA